MDFILEGKKKNCFCLLGKKVFNSPKDIKFEGHRIYCSISKKVTGMYLCLLGRILNFFASSLDVFHFSYFKFAIKLIITSSKDHTYATCAQ